MVVSTLVNIYFTQRDVGNVMHLAQEKSALNILSSLHLMSNSLEKDYRSLLANKIKSIRRNRKHIRETAETITAVFRGYCSANNPSKGMSRALGWIQTASLTKVDYYIIDKDAQVICASDPLITTAFYHGLTDVKQRNISQVMNYGNLPEKGDYASFNIKAAGGENRQVLAYFKPFAPGKITVAVVMEINQMVSLANQKKAEIISSLAEYASSLDIAETGFVYMFDQNDKALIPPPTRKQALLIRSRNQITGNTIHQDIRKTFESHASKFHYRPLSGDSGEKFIVYCNYFKPFQWYISVVVPASEISRPLKTLMIQQSAVIVVMFVAAIAAIVLVVRRIARPLTLLSSYAEKIPNMDFTQPLPEETPIDHLPAKHRDEVGALANSFILMCRELNRNIMNLVEITASRQRIESELSIAREIQLGMVPKTFPGFPQYDQFDLYAVLKPAKEIGGDLYDFFQLDENHIAFTLGDVSDKGIPAALFMVVTRTLVRVLSEEASSPSQMMANINNVLSSDNPRSMFVTLVIGFLNIHTGEITYANGGHNPPVMVKKDGTEFIVERKEPLVGAFPGLEYSDIKVSLEPGESFFLYTDGVNEAMDAAGNQFSNQRLLSQISETRDKSPKEAVCLMLEEIEKHTGTAPQSDDIAMLMITYRGKTGAESA